MVTRGHTNPEVASDSSPPSVELLVAGKSFARYQIVRCIGVGGMGAVFEATHTLLRKRVALKAMHASLGRSESSRSRFLREAETVARIRHRNVVDISDVGIEQGIPFLVMEFLEGEDLANVLEREGRLSVERTMELVLPAVAGLCAVHRLGIVHRDVKPENIFLAVDAYGEVVPKLVDFGVSKDLEASGAARSIPVQHTVAGTPHYMSPEQARGSALLDERTDQYAVGVLLYQCLSGVRPYESDSLLELIHLIDAGTCEPLRKHNPEVSEELEAVIHRAMSRRIDDRFPTSEAFGQALLPFATELVRTSCAREFSVPRTGRVPSHQAEPRVGSSPAAATLKSDDLLVPAVTVSVRPAGRSVSGVRSRDSEPAVSSPPVSAHAASKRAFLWAFALTAVLLTALAIWLMPSSRDGGDSTPKPPGQVEVRSVTPAADPARPGPSDPPALHQEPSQPATAPAQPTEGDKPRRGPRKRNDAKREAAPGPVDIQLSR